MRDSPQNSGEFCFEMLPSELIIYYVVPKRIRRVFCSKLIVRECAKALNGCLALDEGGSGWGTPGPDLNYSRRIFAACQMENREEFIIGSRRQRG